MNKIVPDAEMNKLLRDTIVSDPVLAHQAKMQLGEFLSAALTTPLKQGVMPGDTISGIFDEERFEPGVRTEYPIDIAIPGTEKYHVAYTVPNHGRIPEAHVEGDFLMVPTYEIASSVDWNRKFVRDARWNVVGRALKLADGAHVRKRNNDGWHTLQAAAVDRGLSVYDAQATAGLFTKRLIALAQVIMRRNAGGNSTSVNRGKLTHVAMSPEGLQDIRSWDMTQVDDVTRREIFMMGEGEITATKVFGVYLMDIDEFGVGQEYETYIETTLGASLPGSKLEFALGLDLQNKDSFMSPWVVQPNGQRIEMQPDPTFLRQNREGYWMRQETGFACLDGRRVLLLAF